MAKDKDQEIIDQAMKRFSESEEAESENRELWLEDLQFANGDSDNGYMWDSDLSASRNQANKPTLTINKTKAFNRQIANDYRLNRSSPKVIPAGEGADKETADIFNGIIRHIEAQSCAENAYSLAFDFAVDAGLGYYRITTDYLHSGSFDQEIYVRRIKNPLNVYFDPNIQYADGRDARYCFIIQDMTTEEFEDQYPDSPVSSFSKGNAWTSSDKVRVAEYFRVVDKSDTLYALPDGNTILKSQLQPNDDVTGLKSREVVTQKVEWYKIGNDTILERSDWLGKYIPVVRVVGYELEMEDKTYRCGHTRMLKDVQRMYNYYASSAAEYIGLAGKQPYIAAAEAITGYEQYWDNLNSDDTSYLPYNAYDVQGNALPLPRRQDPPSFAQGYLQGMTVSSEEMQAISGQYNAQLGANPNQQSGVALNALQRKGDTATYHFVDNAEMAKKFTAEIFIDLIPKVYDTPRIIRIIGEDSEEKEIQLDPNAPMAKNEVQVNGEIKQIYNPTVGLYDVVPATGPNYATKRQEQSAGMLAMVNANPQIWQTAGDLIVKSQDWIMSDEISERLKKSLPPGLVVDENAPQMPQIPSELQQQMDAQEKMIAAMDQTIQKLTEERDSNRVEQSINAKKVSIDEYNAITNRLKMVEPNLGPAAVEALVRSTLQDVVSEPATGGELQMTGLYNQLQPMAPQTVPQNVPPMAPPQQNTQPQGLM